ncbi:NAD(P)H-hydrate dehydratase [Roseovarius sp. C7]|uniref:NAD(P)H-hydrate dehydratase n=1 Tax=Roseovarius sp. C7 TaxID=3398643 RepID=UPI0039F64F78
MRALEAAEMNSGRASGRALMERAGRGIVAALLRQWPAWTETPGKAVILCGPGNNGGDGFVVARLLRNRGWELRVGLLGEADRLPAEARANHDLWQSMGAVLPLASVLDEIGAADVIIDALFGIGLSRPLEGAARRWAEMSQADDRIAARTLAIDLPSGLCSERGWPIGHTARAALTVSFHRPKPGHYLGCGPETCGGLAIADIGIETPCPEDAVQRVGAPEPGLWGKTGHKFDNGHALVLCGGFGRSGAARLAARAALRIGAGLVSLGVPGAAQIEVASQITALMMRRIDGAEDLASALQDRRINALCLGPGLGVARAEDLVPVALADGQSAALVLDADALTALGEIGPGRLPPRCVLTPHGGEFARLFPDLALAAGPEGELSKLEATRQAAARAGAVVLYKGPDTVIAAPDGRVALHGAAYERSAPWLATAGSGDVLAGMIAGLMARGIPAMTAAEAACWLHAEAGRSFGPGLIAEDLPEQLPRVMGAALRAGKI